MDRIKQQTTKYERFTHYSATIYTATFTSTWTQKQHQMTHERHVHNSVIQEQIKCTALIVWYQCLLGWQLSSHNTDCHIYIQIPCQPCRTNMDNLSLYPNSALNNHRRYKRRFYFISPYIKITRYLQTWEEPSLPAEPLLTTTFLWDI